MTQPNEHRHHTDSLDVLTTAQRPPTLTIIAVTRVEFLRGEGCCELDPVRSCLAYYDSDGQLLFVDDPSPTDRSVQIEHALGVAAERVLVKYGVPAHGLPLQLQTIASPPHGENTYVAEGNADRGDVSSDIATAVMTALDDDGDGNDALADAARRRRERRT